MTYFKDGNSRVHSSVTLSPGCWVGSGVEMAKDGFIGQNAVIGQAGAEELRGTTIIGENVWIGPHAYIESGVTIEKDCLIGPFAMIRFGSRISQGSRIGTRCTLMDHVFIDEFANLIAEIYICEYARLGKHCQISPGVTLVNDKYPPTALDVQGPVVGDCAVIGVKSVIWPGVKLGYHAMVASLSEVKDDVRDFVLVRGNPAKPVCDVRQIRTKHKDRWVYPYPWMRINSPEADIFKPMYDF